MLRKNKCKLALFGLTAVVSFTALLVVLNAIPD